MGETSDTNEFREFDKTEVDAIDKKDRRWSWVEIDLKAIRHNVAQTRRHLKPGTHLMAVVKADAYGHGAVQVAKASLQSGADYLGVATVDEGIKLRNADIQAPILILAQPPVEAIPLLLTYHIMPSIYDPEFAIVYGETADLHGMKAPFHLAVNTGMNRIGVRWDEVIEFERAIMFHRALDQVGMFTHFATADVGETFDFDVQARRFVEVVESLKMANIDPGIVHCANSAAIFRYPHVHFDMVRLGIALYGLHPCVETRTIVDLHPAMSVHARITDVRTPGMSEGVSYGLNYRSPGSVKICTLPLGYADGFMRTLSNRVDVIYQGYRCHQAGNICMDQCMFEVDMRAYAMRPRLDPRVGDEVTIIGREGDSIVTLDDHANIAGTITHEVAIGFSHRLPRYYV